jgi:hypothetical protein
VSGVLNAMVGQGGGSRFSVTIANFSSTRYGYTSTGPSGAISPSDFRGVTITGIASNASPGQLFIVAMQGSRAQSFFAGIEVQRTDGTTQVFTTSSAIFADLGTDTSWSWANSPAYVWSATTPSPRLIRIF